MKGAGFLACPPPFKVIDNENNSKTNAKILSTAIQALPPNYALSVFIAVLIALYNIKVWSVNCRIRDVVHRVDDRRLSQIYWAG